MMFLRIDEKMANLIVRALSERIAREASDTGIGELDIKLELSIIGGIVAARRRELSSVDGNSQLDACISNLDAGALDPAGCVALSSEDCDSLICLLLELRDFREAYKDDRP